MAQMIMFILNDADHLSQLYHAWEGSGVSGVTILPGQALQQHSLVHLGARYPFGFSRGSQELEEDRQILLAFAHDREIVQACLDATEGVVGDLDESHAGLFAAWPVVQLKGWPSATATDHTSNRS